MGLKLNWQKEEFFAQTIPLIRKGKYLRPEALNSGKKWENKAKRISNDSNLAVMNIGHKFSAELHDVSQGYNSPLENNPEYWLAQKTYTAYIIYNTKKSEAD